MDLVSKETAKFEPKNRSIAATEVTHGVKPTLPTKQQADVIKPPCECCECRLQFRRVSKQEAKIFTYSKAISDDEARHQATVFLESTNDDLRYLSEKCSLNGNAILKRWKKKSQEARRAFLLEIDPDMYPFQWCEARFDCTSACALREERHKPDDKQNRHLARGTVRRAYRSVCLLPYVNLQELSTNPVRFLSLLYQRVQYTPEQWSSYDNFRLNEQWHVGGLETTFNAKCIVMHGLEFGKLVDWDATAAHSWSTIGFPRGILILEAQQKLARFLRSAVDLLLTGLVNDSRTNQSDHFTKAIASGPHITEDGFASYGNQPFSPPPKFDLERLLALTKSQLQSHGDHLWLLQTDARYMRKCVTSILAGRFDASDSESVTYSRAFESLFYDTSLYWTWEWIQEELLKVQGLYSKHCGTGLLGRPLPEEYEEALSFLEFLLLVLLKKRAHTLGYIWSCQPGWRDTSSRGNVPSATGSMKFLEPESNLVISEFLFMDRLHFCLTSMSDDPYVEASVDGTPRQDYSVLFSMLQEHLNDCAKKGKKEETSRMNESLSVLFSDLSAIYQLLANVRLHRPRARQADIPCIGPIDKRKAMRYMRAGFLTHTSYQQQVYDTIGRCSVDINHHILGGHATTQPWSMSHVGMSLKNFMNSPQPRGCRLSHARLDMESVELANLGKFWHAVRKRHRRLCSFIGIEESEIDADMHVLSADSDLQYLKEIQTDRENILAKIAEKELLKVQKAGTAANTLVMQWAAETQGETQGETNLEVKKLKLKTRGAATNSSASDDATSRLENEIRSAPAEPQIQVIINKRAFTVFKGLIPGDDIEARTQCVLWSSFLNAMAAPGVEFIARGGGGSEFTFEPSASSKWARMGSIVFHKPHPDGEIDPIRLASWGKRMNKWFGWNEGTFLQKT